MPYVKSRERKTRTMEQDHDKRDILAKTIGKSDYYTGTFVKYGYLFANSQNNKTILLTGIKDSLHRFIAKHLWMPATEEMMLLCLTYGDRIEFEGTPAKYEKGVVTADLIYEAYTIENPKNISKIGRVNF